MAQSPESTGEEETTSPPVEPVWNEDWDTDPVSHVGEIVAYAAQMRAYAQAMEQGWIDAADFCDEISEQNTTLEKQLEEEAERCRFTAEVLNAIGSSVLAAMAPNQRRRIGFQPIALALLGKFPGALEDDTVFDDWIAEAIRVNGGHPGSDALDRLANRLGTIAGGNTDG